ncbi:hypothetical protein [Parasphingorhabdus sp.]|uniref:hypothetical protein n=1 Tax=Parasphingorhabdus sp. TaxID=2709688 RepID=UPI00326445EE
MATDQDKKPAAKKPAARKTAAKKPARKASAAKKTTTRKKAAAKPSAPLKTGATRAASSKSKIVDTDGLKDKAIEKARAAANQGKERTGGAIGNLGKLIDDSAQTLDENVGEKYGDYARSAADAVSTFAEKIDEKDVDEMVEDARQFVRKSPAVAIGAAAVVGFLVSRLIKSGMDDRS